MGGIADTMGTNKRLPFPLLQLSIPTAARLSAAPRDNPATPIPLAVYSAAALVSNASNMVVICISV